MTVQWVVKLSKLCNLRCAYCYELDNLAVRDRIEPEQLTALFRHARENSFQHGEDVEFVWHGGEPLIAPEGYFDELFDLQHAVFAESDIEVRNTVQTNLYSVNDHTIELLRRFDTIGVSIDLFGGLRVNAAGQSSQQRVLTNLHRIRQAGIRFGCITVLSCPIAEHIDAMFDFYARNGISFRLLPIYRTAYPGQHDAWALTPDGVERALIRVFDRMVSESPEISISPIDEYLATVLRRYTGLGPPQPYPMGEQPEQMLLVDTDGTTYASTSAYQAGYAYGNAFQDSVVAMLRSKGYRRTIQERRERCRACDACEFADVCPRTYLAEATPEQHAHDGHCPAARRLHRHVEDWLNESGLVMGGSMLDAIRINRVFEAAS